MDYFFLLLSSYFEILFAVRHIDFLLKCCKQLLKRWSFEHELTELRSVSVTAIEVKTLITEDLFTDTNDVDDLSASSLT